MYIVTDVFWSLSKIYLFPLYLPSVHSPNFLLGNFKMFQLQYLLFPLALINKICIILITSLETDWNHCKKEFQWIIYMQTKRISTHHLSLFPDFWMNDSPIPAMHSFLRGGFLAYKSFDLNTVVLPGDWVISINGPELCSSFPNMI